MQRQLSKKHAEIIEVPNSVVGSDNVSAISTARGQNNRKGCDKGRPESDRFQTPSVRRSAGKDNDDRNRPNKSQVLAKG